MANRSKHKKGEGAGFHWIIAIIVLVLSAGVILWVLKASSAKAEEKTQVDLCRLSNEIRVGVEHRTNEYASTPRFCNTVDKTSGKAMVPTKKYPQKDEGVSEEIRDMLKNCWYMWLEGSELNIFRLFPGKKSCAMCYKFKVKDGLKDEDGNPVTVDPVGLVERMQDPYFASDTSDKCVAPNGGYLREDDNCRGQSPSGREQDPEGEEEFKKKVSGKFCCRRDLINECYNKGGQCLEDPDSTYESKYNKWACPSEKTCYVIKNNMVSYMEYIVESSDIEGKPAGDFYIQGIGPYENKEGPTDSISTEYPLDIKYAISFISPSEDCGWLGHDCWGVAFDSWVYSNLPGPIETWGRHRVESDTPDFKPSNLLLSTYELAQGMGCSEG